MPIQSVDLIATITDAAARYHLNADHFVAVANCEDPGLIPDQQSHAIQKDGTRERSFGIFQINLDHNPSVSYENAIDPVFAADWAAAQWAHGHADHWTCFRNLFE